MTRCSGSGYIVGVSRWENPKGNIELSTFISSHQKVPLSELNINDTYTLIYFTKEDNDIPSQSSGIMVSWLGVSMYSIANLFYNLSEPNFPLLKNGQDSSKFAGLLWELHEIANIEC